MEPNKKLPVYKLLIIGANGGIGRQCVEVALQAGHQVTALLRTPAKLTIQHPHLEIIKGDILHPETYQGHLESMDAVISAIGVNGGFFSDKPTTLYSQGNACLLGAMNKAGVKRGFFISASAIEISPVLPFYIRWAEKYIVQKLLRNMYDDLRRMEKLIKESNADWTIIRPPQLSDKPVTGKYRVAINGFLENCLKISRADVAHYIIHNITNTLTYKGVIEIAY
jgi:putative NADH-flavin reductase